MDRTIDIRLSDSDAGRRRHAEGRHRGGARAHRALLDHHTARADGHPHVTPLIGVWHDGATHLCTGMREQKAHNLVHNDSVALTTGINTWAEGLDVVVENTAVRVTDKSARAARPTKRLSGDAAADTERAAFPLSSLSDRLR